MANKDLSLIREGKIQGLILMGFGFILLFAFMALFAAQNRENPPAHRIMELPYICFALFIIFIGFVAFLYYNFKEPY